MYIHWVCFKKNATISDCIFAEDVGFEPTVPCGTTVFKTAAIDHSANLPLSFSQEYYLFLFFAFT
jgi:hypothetical protein